MNKQAGVEGVDYLAARGLDRALLLYSPVNSARTGTVREHPMKATLCAVCISIAGAGASTAQTALTPHPPSLVQTKAEWAKDVTALVMAPDGTWGTATEPHSGQALTKAIADCKTKYSRKIGCGYRSTFVREGWSLGIRCGQVNIIVAEKTFPAAEKTAAVSEFIQRRDYNPDMPSCVRVVTVDPDGRVIVPDISHFFQTSRTQGTD